MRNWYLGLAAVVAVASPAAADDAKQDKDAVAVVKKAIDAHGGADALNKYKAGTVKIKGTAAVMGFDMAFTGEVTYALPDKYKMSMDADLMGQKLTIKNITDGKTAKTTVNGMAAPIPEAAKEEMMMQAVEMEVAQLTPLLDAAKFTIKAGPDADVDGKKASLVIVSGKRLKDKEWKLYFDKESGLFVKQQKKGTNPSGDGEVDEESFMTGYKKMDGVMTATKVAVKHDGAKFLTFEVLEAKYKEKIDDKEFAIDD